MFTLSRKDLRAASQNFSITLSGTRLSNKNGSLNFALNTTSHNWSPFSCTLHCPSKVSKGPSICSILISLSDIIFFDLIEYCLNKKSNFNNGEGQKLKWDRRKDGKLDITFLRINRTKKEMKKSKWGSCANVFGRSIINNGMHNPKKIYFNFGDFSFKDWPYSGGFPIFNVFSRHQKKWPLNKEEVGYFILHEGIHAMGGIFPCSPNFFQGHNTKNNKSGGDMMARQVGAGSRNLDPKNDDYWGHSNKNCPDLQDSVYFTPTSDTPYDPFEVICLPKEKWKLTQHNYENYIDTHFDKCFYRKI